MPNPEIDLASLGEFTPDDQRNVPAPEPEAKVPEPEPTPEPGPDEAPAPEPEPADNADDEFEDVTLDDIDERIQKAIREYDPLAEPDDTQDVPPEAKKLAEENAALKAKLAEQESRAAETAKQAAIADMTKAINSTIGLYKMTDAEVQATTDYLVANPDLARGGMTFAEAASRRFPGITDRARSAPAIKEQPTDGSLQPPSANGAGAPKKFQHVPNRGDYHDVNQHIVQSGLAASLGKYT